MKFIVTRTSDWNNPQCEEAKLETHDEHGGEVYSIEVNSIEELVNLSNKYGEIIITDNDFYKDCCPDIPKEIEIYDSYRE